MQIDQRLAEIIRSLVPPGKKVLEFSHGESRLLDAIRPEVGVNVRLDQPNMEPMIEGVAAHCGGSNQFLVGVERTDFDFVILNNLKTQHSIILLV